MKIHTIDLDFQGIAMAIASYLIVGPDGPVLVEVGPATTREKLVAGLETHGVRPGDVRDVLVTHIHLDHAGDAGWWAGQGATVHVHANGAPHLIDPSRLLASATRIYGDRMDTLWGEVLPIPEARIAPIDNGDRIEAGGLVFTAIDAPGHARHHHVFRLDDIAFTGDAAGIRLPGSPLLELPSPPPEFDPESWEGTIDRLIEEKFERIYPTHFGPVDEVRDHLIRLRALLREATGFIFDRLQGRIEREDLIEQYISWNRSRARAAGLDMSMIERYELANPPHMSVDGIARYCRKREQGGQ